jgi:aldose sugar dehydrogenase
LYYTESKNGDGNDVCSDATGSYTCKSGTEPIGNRLYRYELVNNKLVNPKLLLDLPGTPGPAHNGGAIQIGPDNNVYVTIGDLNNKDTSMKVQNVQRGENPDGRGGILSVTQDGKTVGNGILGSDNPLNKYYGYGIRNSFGIDFDPLTGNLWDTKNGPAYGDEINLVQPGFNSGWKVLQGIWRPFAPPEGDSVEGKKLLEPDNFLVNFEGKGHYRSPEFIWKNTVGPTAIKFLNSDRLGKKYENDMFVGCVNSGIIFHFDLSKDRTKLKLNGVLQAKIAYDTDQLQDVIFARGLGQITDIDVGPDGYLYALSSYMDKATIFRIVPINY